MIFNYKNMFKQNRYLGYLIYYFKKMLLKLEKLKKLTF